MDLEQALTEGIIFSKQKEPADKNKTDKVKTKAKKITFIKGSHDSGAAKKKAEYRKKRSIRNKK